MRGVRGMGIEILSWAAIMFCVYLQTRSIINRAFREVETGLYLIVFVVVSKLLLIFIYQMCLGSSHIRFCSQLTAAQIASDELFVDLASLFDTD